MPSNKSSATKQKNDRPKFKFFKSKFTLLFLLTALLGGGTLAAQILPSGFFSSLQNSFGLTANPSPTPQTKRPKKKTQSGEQNRGNLTGGENTENLTTPLASTDFDLIGLAVTVTPATQTVPKNTPTGLLTSIQVPDGTDPSEIIANINPNFRIRGELVGPSLTAPQTLETQIGQILPIPPLAVNGDHQVQNLRVVDIGTAGEPTIAAVSPDSCGITVIDNILVSQVQVNEMTYEQIVQSGINLTNDNYNFFNFTFALATSSGTVPISIPVALPSANAPNQPPITGAPSTNIPGVPVPDVVPVIFTVEGDEGNGGNQQPTLPGGEPVRIPGAIIFPGRIGLLHQFFEAIVIVSNGAPNGTPLVITNLRAKASLPDNGTPTNEADDPLRIAETQVGGRISELDIHGLGPDGRYGTADDLLSFSPGQTGQASFLLEGLKEGLHTVNFDLQGTLNGLPTGAVNIRGQVPGAVLVRDASFGVTFTHPSIVRAGQEYDLGMTVYNSGNSILNGVSLQLAGNSVSGATLIDDELKMLTQSIPRGSSGTVKWRLRANVTGQVTASYVKVGDGINAGLQLVTGVGDRNIPLSPDSLILPDPVRHLPPDIVESARQLLGQGWSVATAPPGALPPGVAPISKQTIINRAVELGFAGLRKDFNEPRDTTIQTLTRDWLGELSPDTGFADALRNTPAGYYFFDTVGTKFHNSIENGQTPAGLHQLFTSQELSRSTFVSALVTQSSGVPIVGAKLLSPSNEKVGWGANPDERFGELQKGASFNLLANDPHDVNNPTRGQMLVVSSPSSGNWKLELTGWGEGTADVSIVAQLSGKNYRQILVNGLSFTADKRYRVTFRSSGTTAPIVEELVNGSYQTVSNASVVINTLNEPNSSVVGVVQVTPDVVGGGDPFGRLVGVLFSKPMDKTSVETIAHYQVSGGNLVNSNPVQMVGKPIAVKGGAQNFGNRFVILSLDAPVGPFIERKLSVNGLRDTSGKTVIASTTDINMRVSPQAIPPGAYLTGKVMNADGTPVPNAVVQYMTDPQNVVPNRCDVGSTDPQEVAHRVTDASGEFQFDYVREGKCLPILLRATNVATNSRKTLVSNILYHGQHIVLNAVYLARGKVRGTVTNGGNPLANAYVNIIAESDLNNSKLVRTDAAGNYEATDVPVGNVTVKAVGSGAFSLASGVGSGTISGPGATAIVNVSTQNISGEVSGKVIGPDPNQTPVSGALIIARAQIPGFPTLDPRGTAVGYAYAGQDGNFRITGLPIGNVQLEARDIQTGVGTSLSVQLTTQAPKAQNILFVMPGYGSVSGRVTDEIGQPIPNAQVTAGGQAVVTDNTGNYLLPRLPAGTFGVSARVPALNLSGSTTVTVQNGGETTGADIIIKRPANLTGQIFITENGTTQPLVGAKVTADGFNVVETNSQGRYQINNISAGSYILRVVLESRRLFANQNIILIAGETLTRNVTLYPGKIHGRITQPDGVTSVIATVQGKVPIPYLMAGAFYGLPDGDSSYQFTSGADGTYVFNDVNPGQYVISASNAFFPIKSSKTGNLPPNGNHEVNLSLVDSLAGKIQGTIYQTDGITPVGAGVKVSLGGGSLADVTVRTDETGHYEFAEVFAAGSYSLTALDPLTGRTNRTGISVIRNQDVIADLRLLGRGSLRVRVIDGAGNPVPNGLIRVNGTNYPNDERFTELTAVNGGVMQFDNLNEGNYAVYGEYIGLGGRNSATVTPDGITEVVIQTRASGSIDGRVLMPDGTTPVGLADVTLSQGGRIIGFISSDDSDENRGKFNFQGVPAGDFTVSVFDNRTARVGRFEGRITQQGETVNANISLIAQGSVIGQVTSNGVPVDHALVTISAEGSGIVSVTRIATTDENGNYRFTGIPVGRINVSVSNGPGGLTGFATGIVSGTVEPLPDTVLNVALTPSATINGTIYKNGGTEPFTGAKVTLYSGNRVFRTNSDLNGAYQVNFVPLGQFRVRAEAPSGFDRGQTELLTVNQAGSTVTANITMNGLGTITGEARDSDGSLLNRGSITFTNSDWGSPVTLAATVQANGQYTISNAPSGNFALKLTLADRIGVGTATGSLAAGQTVNVPLQLESAGRIFGNLRQPDGTTPAVGADITLTLSRAAGGHYTFFSHSDSQGNWTFDNLPLGTISVLFSDPNTNGIARLEGQALATNGQIIDTGNIVLDNTPIAVQAVVPVNNATNIPRNSAVQITFSEPVQTASVNSSSVQIRNGNSPINANRNISTDGTVLTLTPTASLADVTTYTVVVSTSVKDRNGLSLLEEFRSNFTTADETAPFVTEVSPLNGANGIPLDNVVTVKFNEPLGDNQQLAEIIKISPLNIPNNPISGNYVLSSDQKTVTFTPSGLTGSTNYQVKVTGQRDIIGNTQNVLFTSTFTTVDNNAPVINAFLINNQTAVSGLTFTNGRVDFAAVYSDDLGINLTGTKLYLAKQGETLQAVAASVSQSGLTYQNAQPLISGVYVTKVVVTDTSGNQTSTPEITFTIDLQSPEILSVTPNSGSQMGYTIATISGRNLLTQYVEPDASARGLLGEYYNRRDNSDIFSELKNIKLENNINFDLSFESLTPYIRPGNDIARWRGKIIPRYSEEYNFTGEYSGKFTLTINGQQLFTDSMSPYIRQQSATITLVAGQEYDILIEQSPYYCCSYDSGSYNNRHVAKLSWSSASQPLEIVPNEQLRPAAVPVAPTVLIGGQPAVVIGGSVSVESEMVAVMIPAGNAGSVSVQVQNDNGTDTEADAYTYVEDTQPPQVWDISPSTYSDPIAPPEKIVVSFNEKLSPNSNFNNILKVYNVTAGDTEVPGNVVLDETGWKLTFTPNQPLTETTQYSIQVFSPQDLAGNVNEYAAGVYFLTTDRVAPVITSLTPDQTIVYTTTPRIEAQYRDDFSAVDAGSIELLIDGVQITSGVNRTPFNMYYTPTTPLSGGTHTVTLRVADISGNIAERTATFTMDNVPPQINNIVVGGQIAVEGLRTHLLRPLIEIYIEDPSLTQASAPAQKLFFGEQGSTLTQVSTPFIRFNGVWYMYYQPPQDLAYGFYSARVELMDNFGNTTIRTVNFEIADLDVIPPQVTEIIPAYGTTQVTAGTNITVTFDEPLDSTQNFADSVTVYDQNYNFLSGNYSLDATGKILTFTPAQPFQDNGYYGIFLSGYRDLAGNQGSYFSSYFLTVDTIAPQVNFSHYIDGEYVNLNGTTIYTRTPAIYVYYPDLNGVDPASVIFTIDGVTVPVQANSYDFLYESPSPLAYGSHTITAQVTDTVGNVSNVATATFTVEIDRRTPFAVEDDTALLWHLDQTGINDYEQFTLDSSPNLINGNGIFYTQQINGRFLRGVQNASFAADEDNNILSFGENGFTVEGWLRYQFYTDNPPSVPITIWSRKSDSQTDFDLTILTNGDLQARVYNANGEVWEAILPKTSFDTGDNQWHSLAMVVERSSNEASQNQLKIYVDGFVRGSAPAPAGFGAMNNSGGRFRLLTDYPPFDIKYDEIRVSSTAHSAEQIRRIYENTDLGLILTRHNPSVLTSGYSNELTLEGYNLDTITNVSVTAPDGSPLPITATVTESTKTIAKLAVNIDQTVPNGEVRLVVTDGVATLTRNLQIAAQRPFVPDAGTMILWHIDEADGSTISDSGLLGATVEASGPAVNGRFANARKGVGTFFYAPQLPFINSSFTTEFWTKLPAVKQESDLFMYGASTECSINETVRLKLLPRGRLAFSLVDTDQNRWEAQTQLRVPNVSDNQWHLITLVVIRGAQPEENLLKIYVDGVERATSVMPTGFGSLNTSRSEIRLNYDYCGDSIDEATMDEFRLLNYARSAAEIQNTWLGVNSLARTALLPKEKNTADGKIIPAEKEKGKVDDEVIQALPNSANSSEKTNTQERLRKLFYIPPAKNLGGNER